MFWALAWFVVISTARKSVAAEAFPAYILPPLFLAKSVLSVRTGLEHLITAANGRRA
jgi:hypothetical protein